MPSRRAILESLSNQNFLSLTPSAVHLINCVLSGSQPPGLSVNAHLFLSPLHRFKALFHLLGVYHFKAIVSMHYFNLFREIVEKFSQFSCLYFLFLFHANPPTPAPSEENASPNKPRTFAGSPVFAAFDPLVPLEADPSVVVPAFFVTVGVALPF